MVKNPFLKNQDGNQTINIMLIQVEDSPIVKQLEFKIILNIISERSTKLTLFFIIYKLTLYVVTYIICNLYNHILYLYYVL